MVSAGVLGPIPDGYWGIDCNSFHLFLLFFMCLLEKTRHVAHTGLAVYPLHGGWVDVLCQESIFYEFITAMITQCIIQIGTQWEGEGVKQIFQKPGRKTWL